MVHCFQKLSNPLPATNINLKINDNSKISNNNNKIGNQYGHSSQIQKIVFVERLYLNRIIST